jgi:hypothetical protein
MSRLQRVALLFFIWFALAAFVPGQQDVFAAVMATISGLCFIGLDSHTR